MALRRDWQPAVTVLDALGSMGRFGAEAGVRIDLLRTVGVRHVWQRRQQASEAARLGAAGVYARIWRAAAHDVGAELIDLSEGFFEVRLGAQRTRMWNHWVMVDDLATMRVALQKTLVHRLLTAAGLPVPQHVPFEAEDLSPALAYLEEGDGPFVVKPVGASGGLSITSGIRTPSQLRRARLRARLAGDLLMELQVPGDNYRFLFLDGELLDVVRRRPPTVTGDGQAEIVELIARENRHRLAVAAGSRPQLLLIDLDAIFTLQNAGLTLASIPAAGARVPVKTVINQNGPEDNESVRGGVSEALVADAALAARVTGVRLAGIDLITPDPSVGLAQAGGAVLEVNSPPGLHYHYEIGNPHEGLPVATPILRELLELEPMFPLIDFDG